MLAGGPAALAWRWAPGRLRLTSSGEDDGETSLGATGLRHAVDTPIPGSDP
jgi:hypothetical protein